ncbi:MAG: glycosyltransferase family 4 protein [Proteobacteria bacterium]|nr:glycosyltransferase family 1 protein [Pseudomonadota bacterium]NOG59114.1 glycosyltransferase family 4 protein [Pseudomonadota bacterium]
MKLVYIINTAGFGGAEIHVLNLARDMVQRGYQITVVFLLQEIRGGADSLETKFIETGADVVYLKSYCLRDVGRWLSLTKLLCQIRPDIIHSHLPRSDLAASIAKVIFPDVKWICTLHDTYTRDKFAGHKILSLIRWNWQRADYIIAVSKHVQEWGAQFFTFPKHRTRAIYHGVQFNKTPQSIKKSSRESFKIGCLARFEKRKGIETLVRSMVKVIKNYPDAQLLLAGSDPTGYSNTIKMLAESLNVKNNVKIQGFCKKPLEFLNDLDVFAFASSSEGFGIVLIEAMSVRKPIVASDIYPINHIVQQGISGLLVEADNDDLFADALIELLSDPEKCQSMGENGYQRLINEFSLEKSMNKTHDLYMELMS